jgi:uncharacterized protein
MKLKVAITGSSGLVGRVLVPFLATAGYEVVRLVRRPITTKDEVSWDPEIGTIDTAALEGVDAVIHLAGESIAAGRWTAARKARLRSSRVVPTRLLAETLARLTTRPQVLVSASAIGFYGNRGEVSLSERDEPADDFLGRLSVDWETAAVAAESAGIRVVYARMGVVLTAAGGALGRMLMPFRLGLGGKLGPGTQFLSWIATDDLMGVFLHLLHRSDIRGAVNVVAPRPVTNAEFTKTLGRVLDRPTLLGVPAFALRLALGEMADATLLASTRVRPEHLEATGYQFRFAELEGALRHCLGRTDPGQA